MQKIYNIKLELESSEHLLEEESGIGIIKNIIDYHGVDKSYQLSVQSEKPISTNEIIKTLNIYCRKMIVYDELQIKVQRNTGRRRLIAIIPIFLILLFFLFLISLFNSANLTAIAGSMVTIVSWVILWNPIELLLYEPQTLRRDIKIYKKILEIEDKDIIIA